MLCPETLGSLPQLDDATVRRILPAASLPASGTDVFERRILGFHGLQGFDHIVGLAAQPDFLFYAIFQPGESGWRSGRAPGSTLSILT